MKLHLKRVSIWPVVKVTFMVSLVLGFILGLIYALFLAFIIAVGSAFQPYGTEEFGMASAGALIVLMPVFLAFFTAVMYTLMALVSTLCYNFVARTMGGLEYEVEVLSSESDPDRMTVAPTPPAHKPRAPEPGPSGPVPPPQQDPPANYSI